MLADLCIIKERTSGLGGDLYSPSALSSLIVDFVPFLTSPSLTQISFFHSGISFRLLRQSLTSGT